MPGCQDPLREKKPKTTTQTEKTHLLPRRTAILPNLRSCIYLQTGLVSGTPRFSTSCPSPRQSRTTGGGSARGPRFVWAAPSPLTCRWGSSREGPCTHLPLHWEPRTFRHCEWINEFWDCRINSSFQISGYLVGGTLLCTTRSPGQEESPAQRAPESGSNDRGQ